MITQENYKATFIVSKASTKSTASESSDTMCLPQNKQIPAIKQLTDFQHTNGCAKPSIPSPYCFPYVMTTIDYMTSIYSYITYLEFILLECRIKTMEAWVLRKILDDCKEILNQLEYAKKHFTNDTEKGNLVKRPLQLLYE